MKKKYGVVILFAVIAVVVLIAIWPRRGFPVLKYEGETYKIGMELDVDELEKNTEVRSRR